MMALLSGERFEVSIFDSNYPAGLLKVRNPPKRIYVIGSLDAINEGLAVVGARKATPYGIGVAKRFSKMAAERGIEIISGGARGCDAASHWGALEVGGKTVVFLGGGCDRLYPKENARLFQEIIDAGGAIVSEHEWDVDPRRGMFRERNRLIAGLAKATLIVEAGLPSGTFSTADEALDANRSVLVVPGAITSKNSHGANRLIYQGATPIIDDDTFQDQLFDIFGLLKMGSVVGSSEGSELDDRSFEGFLLKSLAAEQLSLQELCSLAAAEFKGRHSSKDVMIWIASAEKNGLIDKYPSGRYGVRIAKMGEKLLCK